MLKYLNLKQFILFLVCLLLIVQNIDANGDLTKKKPIEKVIFLKGTEGENQSFEPNTIELTTGKLYKLLIVNKSTSKHYFTSEQFAKSIFTRKIQIKSKEKKIAEVKGIIHEVEVFPNESIEWWFVPIKTGIFNDLKCRIKDKITGLEHSEMGMVGRIIIK